jgi:hypothetical protein
MGRPYIFIVQESEIDSKLHVVWSNMSKKH